jgi:hypothetical protein
MRSAEKTAEGTHTRPGFIESHLWIPQVPTYKSLLVSTLEPARASRAFQPLIDIDFGGLRGILLASLTRIVVHMASDECPIIGMEFFYPDRGIQFGHRGESEISFLIDGPGGERITGIAIAIDDPDLGIRGLQV